MSRGINDLLDGKGFVYKVEKGTSNILEAIPNTPESRTRIKNLSLEITTLYTNLISTGSITITAVSGTNNVTAIRIGAENQISANIDVTGKDTTTLATAVANAVNSWTPPAGVDYTASAVGTKVTIYSTVADGAGSNGFTIAFITDDVAITATTVDMANGTTANDTADFDVYVDADYSSSSTSCAGDGVAEEDSIANAIDITDKFVHTSANTNIKNDDYVIADDSITPLRKGAKSTLTVDTESAAPTDGLTTIGAENHVEGDIIVITGLDTGKVTTIQDSGNIKMAAGNFVTAGVEAKLTLVRTDKHATVAVKWVETSRSLGQVPTVTEFRLNDYPFGIEGYLTTALPTSGIITLTPGTSKVWQTYTGTQTLSGNLSIEFATATAKEGDKFIVEYKGIITLGAFAFKIGGLPLTAKQALIGNLIIEGRYYGSAWRVTIRTNIYNNLAKLENDDILDATLKIEKVTADRKTEIISKEISFETGEIGDMKLQLPYKGSITKISVWVSKLIEATDDGSIVFKNAAAVTFATITVVKNSAIGTGFSDSPSANNTFDAGDTLVFTPSKVTAGGKVNVDFQITRID